MVTPKTDVNSQWTEESFLVEQLVQKAQRSRRPPSHCINLKKPSLTFALITLSVLLSIAVGIVVWAVMDRLIAAGREELARDLNTKTFAAFTDQVEYFGQSTAWSAQLGSESIRLSLKEYPVLRDFSSNFQGGDNYLKCTCNITLRRTLFDIAKQFKSMFLAYSAEGLAQGFHKDGQSLLDVSVSNNTLRITRTNQFGVSVGPPLATVPFIISTRPWYAGSTWNTTWYSPVYLDAASNSAILTTTSLVFKDLQPTPSVPGIRNQPQLFQLPLPPPEKRELLALVAVDAKMSDISERFGSISIGLDRGGLYFLMDRFGRVLASSNYSMVPGATAMPHVTQVENQLVNASMEHIMSINRQLNWAADPDFTEIRDMAYSLFDVNGSRWIVGVHHVQINAQAEVWTGVLVFSEQDYFSAQQYASSVALGVAIGSIIPMLSILYGLVVYLKVSRPLTIISHRLDNAVTEFELDSSQLQLDMTSQVQEIHSMQNSYRNLIIGLKSFSKYVPMDIVKDLVTSGVEAEHHMENKRCSYYFSDIERFSGLAEKLSPADLVIILREYFQAMCPIIKENHGVIGDFIGDGIFAFWGAFQESQHHARDCLTAAWIHQKKMAALREDWLARGLPGMKTRIGINTGWALAGNTGTDYRMKYTMIGDSVNLAARLENANKYYGTYLIVSQETWLEPGVQQRFYSRVLDIITVQGRENPVTVREIIGRSDEGTPEERERCAMIQSLSERWLELYLLKDFQASKEILLEISALDGHSDACAILIARVDEFIVEGVSRSWKGISSVRKE